MKDENIYWGDFHKHLSDMENIDEIIEDAKYNLDFYPILCYPFERFKLRGLYVESVKQKSVFLERWKRIKQAVKQHNRPGEFVAFIGYEWHGNRSRWGDHNVIYFDEENPLDDTWELPDLFDNLKKRKAVAIPHHTAYQLHFRGKDWSFFDPEISPVTEIYSCHGSSESIDSPVSMAQNLSMGPRVSGGTYVDALNMGIKTGAIASNDAHGLPGAWGNGAAAVVAKELTRESLWESIITRKTYAVTGDRIGLRFSINDKPMGSINNIKGEKKLEADLSINCMQPLDRIDIIHNGKRFESYAHNTHENFASGIYKILIECGWGPSDAYGFRKDEIGADWTGKVNVKGGSIKNIMPRFSNFGQKYELKNKHSCVFQLKTSRITPQAATQGLIFEVNGNMDTRIELEIEDCNYSTQIKEILNKSHMIPMLAESERRIFEKFKVKKGNLENHDVFFHNARKIKVSPAHHESLCSANISFKNLPVDNGWNYYYVRGFQIDGQAVWSSPIWFNNSNN